MFVFYLFHDIYSISIPFSIFHDGYSRLFLLFSFYFLDHRLSYHRHPFVNPLSNHKRNILFLVRCSSSIFHVPIFFPYRSHPPFILLSIPCILSLFTFCFPLPFSIVIILLIFIFFPHSFFQFLICFIFFSFYLLALAFHILIHSVIPSFIFCIFFLLPPLPSLSPFYSCILSFCILFYISLVSITFYFLFYTFSYFLSFSRSDFLFICSSSTICPYVYSSIFFRTYFWRPFSLPILPLYLVTLTLLSILHPYSVPSNLCSVLHLSCVLCPHHSPNLVLIFPVYPDSPKTSVSQREKREQK